MKSLPAGGRLLATEETTLRHLHTFTCGVGFAEQTGQCAQQRENARSSLFGRRLDDKFKREVAALASRPGARLEQAASDLGVSPWSVSHWKKQYGGEAPCVCAPASTSPAGGTSVQELERRIKALERENADLHEQRTILKKAVAIFSGYPR